MLNQKKISTELPNKNKRKYLVVLAVLLIIGLGFTIAHNHKKAPGVYLTGQLTHVKLNTPYTYTVEIIENKSYQNVNFYFGVPPSLSSTYVNIPQITANKPWIKNFTVEFTSTNSIKTTGIVLEAGCWVKLKSGLEAKTLFHNNYPVTLAPGVHNTSTVKLPPGLPL